MRLKAFQAGRPLPLGQTLRVWVAPPGNVLIVCFVRMGGESAPWGIAFGPPGKAPKVLTVPEPRNRDMVADMAAEFAPVLLAQLQHPANGGRHAESADDLRPTQIWVPNPSHLEMFHNLAYAYTFTKFGPARRAEVLNRLGRAAGWLFREAQRPGQTVVAVATEALKQAFTFPTEDIRQGHLGYLLAWLETPGKRERRMARAHEDERLSMSTTLNPEEETTLLEQPVEDFNRARRGGDAKAQKRLEAVIDGRLRESLVRRFAVTDRAIAVLRNDRRPPNRYLDVLAKASRDEQWRQYIRMEQRFDDPDDGPPFVASRAVAPARAT